MPTEFELEKKVMAQCLPNPKVLRLVSLLRSYRAFAYGVKEARHRDGEVDCATLNMLFSRLQDGIDAALEE